MEEDVGIVIRTDGMNAIVKVEKKDACEDCGLGGECKSTDDGIEIDAINQLHAKVGQTVRISMKPLAYLKGSMLIFGMPVVLFIAGAIVGKIVGEEYMAGMNSDIVAAIAGFSALLLSLFGVRQYSNKNEKKAEYKPFIEEII